MSMKLGDLPADMKKSFRPYALGDHDDAEIDLKKLPVCTDKGMPVLAYPESSREKMKAFDANGDGYVEMYELERAAELYSESKNTSKRLMQLVAMLLAIIAVLTGVIAGCTYARNHVQVHEAGWHCDRSERKHNLHGELNVLRSRQYG